MGKSGNFGILGKRFLWEGVGDFEKLRGKNLRNERIRISKYYGRIFIAMMYITMSLVVLVILICMIVVLTWGLSVWWFYKRHEGDIVKMEKCPFKTPCLKYDEVESKEAVRRVERLI